MRSSSVGPIPALPGTYILVLAAQTRRPVSVGALGSLEVEPGFYAYVGSALGPGGLRARVARHRGRARAPHWHIDYLRRHTALREIWFSADGVRREHGWAAALARDAGATIPCVGFGASDCGCSAHLFRFARRPRLSQFRRQLGTSICASAVA